MSGEWTDDEVAGRLTRTATTPWARRLSRFAKDFLAMRSKIKRLEIEKQELQEENALLRLRVHRHE